MIDQDSSQHSHWSVDTMSTTTSTPCSPSRGFSSILSRDKSFRFADYLAKEEQKVLSEEIRRCKTHVKNLEMSYKLHNDFKRCKNPHCLLAKKYATDLAEEIETCKYEFCGHHHGVCVNASRPYSLASLFSRSTRRSRESPSAMHSCEC